LVVPGLEAVRWSELEELFSKARQGAKYPGVLQALAQLYERGAPME
jgi:hypothetical protein